MLAVSALAKQQMHPRLTFCRKCGISRFLFYCHFLHQEVEGNKPNSRLQVESRRLIYLRTPGGISICVCAVRTRCFLQEVGPSLSVNVASFSLGVRSSRSQGVLVNGFSVTYLK